MTAFLDVLESIATLGSPKPAKVAFSFGSTFVWVCWGFIGLRMSGFRVVELEDVCAWSRFQSEFLPERELAVLAGSETRGEGLDSLSKISVHISCSRHLVLQEKNYPLSSG